MTQTIKNLTFVCAAISPLVWTLSCNLILIEFTFVDSSICPSECTFAVKETMAQFTFKFMTILENASALSMEHFTNLAK